MDNYLNADFDFDYDIPITNNEPVNDEKAHIIATSMTLCDNIRDDKIAEAANQYDMLQVIANNKE